MKDAEPDPNDSRAEVLFADMLVRDAAAGEREVEALCRSHPELAAGLRELLRQKRALGGIDLALPGEAAAGGQPPPRLGPFEPQRLLGRGGMGEVWEAIDHALQRRVALKLLPRGAYAGAKELERFRRESLAAARLRHSAVVAVHSAGEVDGRLYIAQELVEGGRTLRDEIEALRRAVEVPRDHEQRMARLFLQLADALCAAHAAGIVHRDVKPQNVLLDPDGAPKLADFGLAKLVGDTGLSRSGEFVGTWPYASPEVVARGAAAADERSDVFSLGATLYEALVFARPFPGDSLQQIARSILERDPPAAHSLRPRVPRDLSAIASKALEKHVARRYASMVEMRDDLRRFLAHEPTRARAPSPAARAGKWARRHPTATSSLTLSALGFLAVLLLLLRSESLRRQAEGARESERAVNAQLADSRDDAREQARRAGAEAALSEQVLTFLESLFAGSDPALYGLEEPTLRELVGRGVERLRASPELDPRARARLSRHLGYLTHRLGDQELGVELLDDACRLWEELGLGSGEEVMRARVSLAGARIDLGQDAAAEALLAPLIEGWRSGSLPSSLAWTALDCRGTLRSRMGRTQDAEQDLLEALALVRAELGDLAAATVDVRTHLAEVQCDQGRFEEAEELLREDAARLAPLVREGNPSALRLFHTLGLVLSLAKRPEEAEAAFADALAGARERFGTDHPHTIQLATSLATVLDEQGRSQEAEPLHREVLAASRRRHGPGSELSITAQNNLAVNLMSRGRLAEAESLLREAFLDAHALRGLDHLQTARTAANLAICLWRMGRGAEGAGLLEEVLGELTADAAVRAGFERILAGVRGDPP